MFKSKSFIVAIVMMMALTVILSACGGNKNNTNRANNGGTTETTPPAQETAAPTDAPVESELRDFETAKGIVKIPAKPQRIVTDYYGGELLSVGANVVGVETTTFDNPFLKDLLTNTEDVGAEVNLEKTLSLAPDLIVVMYDKNYEELSKIAPTIHIPYGTATNIYETVKLFGDIVGAPDKAEAFISDYEEKAAAGREKLKGVIDENATVGLYELTDKGELWIFGDNGGRGGQAVYNALKLKMPAKDFKNEITQISLEVLPEYAADYMFLTTYDPDKKGEESKKLKDSAIWKSLDTYKKNNIFFNDFDTFYRYDPIAIKGQIDLFVNLLLERTEENKK
ncbi:iron-hydroxamate ABC transporter substrate-binding protein [Paenibacillus sp. YIM B09110]|uniref:iron-hydroxamate ABC transporter substrate-binding protein n=1 Tax=Paenibacillus sp. YIM B09110 TaxID=3126102 RepID=UPI00301DE140